MTESKIELTERLRREGRWGEASRFKDTTVKEFRKGMTRADATEAAWEAMAKAFPPLPPAERSPESSADNADVDPDAGLSSEERERILLADVPRMVPLIAEARVRVWVDVFGLSIPDDARADLVDGIATFAQDCMEAVRHASVPS